MGFFDDAIGSIGKSLATSATSYLTETTGYDVGGTMAFLFGNGQTNKGDTLDGLIAGIGSEFSGNADSLALLQDDLNNQAVQIGLIGDQLTAMSTAIQDIDGEIKGIEALLDKINQGQLYLTWQAQDSQIKNYIIKINSTFKTYALYVAQEAEVSDVAALATSILDPNNGELDAANAINGFMLTDQQNKGALQLWAEMTCPLIEAGLLDYRQAVDQYFAYYTKLAWAQLRATNLLMEAYHFHGSQDDELAADIWKSYQTLILSQETEFIGNLVSIVRSGVVCSVYYPQTAYQSVTQFHPDFTPLFDSNSNYLGTYYEPASVLMKGEALLARLALNDPDDRRMVVHMTYLGDAYKTAIDAAVITLSMNSQTSGGTVQPDSNPAVYGPMPSPGTAYSFQSFNLDPAWVSDNTFYVKRLVYSGSAATPLADGLYQLTNMNGSGSLVPLDTYYGTMPFQSAPVLGYTMEIHAAQPFDYMNFAGYFGNYHGTE
jgi:hypothetical protein